MVDVFENVPEQLKKKIIAAWREMDEDEKTHFVNQVALGMSIWGSDVEGNMMVVKVLELMANDGSSNLVDFGLYVSGLLDQDGLNREEKVKRASGIIERYREKNALPSEPHKDLF